MKFRTVTLALLAALTLPAAVQAQGLVRGAQEGAADGSAAAGPVGGIVGGAVGAATGAVGGLLGVDERPRFRGYVERERRPSYAWRDEVRVGAVLPGSGVTYYDVPSEYGARGYRYTVVNNQPVLVDPRSHRIVQVID